MHNEHITFGLVLIILNGVLIVYFYYCFSNSVLNTNNYNPDICIIKSKRILNYNINCIDDSANVFTVYMPCILIHVDTKRYTKIVFYRNYEEKSWTYQNGVNVSEKIF